MPTREPYEWLGTSALEVAPRFSPDGHLVAYLSDESGGNVLDVFVRGFPQGEKIQISTGGGVDHAWSPDGRELFFVDSKRRLMAVSVTATPRLRASRPRAQFVVPFRPNLRGRARDYDVLPDGSGFVMVEQTSELAPPTNIQLVTGWFEELRRSEKSRP